MTFSLNVFDEDTRAVIHIFTKITFWLASACISVLFFFSAGVLLSLWYDAKDRSFLSGPVRRQITKLLSVTKYDICTNSASVIFSVSRAYAMKFTLHCDRNAFPPIRVICTNANRILSKRRHPALDFLYTFRAPIFVKPSDCSSSFRNLGKPRYAIVNHLADLKQLIVFILETYMPVEFSVQPDEDQRHASEVFDGIVIRRGRVCGIAAVWHRRACVSFWNTNYEAKLGEQSSENLLSSQQFRSVTTSPMGATYGKMKITTLK